MSSILPLILKAASQDLTGAGVNFAVVGGLAIGARVQLRYTQDVDLVVAVDDQAHAEAVGGYLIRYGYRPMMELDHTSTGRLATLRLLSPHLPPDTDPTDAPLVDVLFASCGIEAEVVAAAEPAPVFPDLTLPIARIPHLIAMKLVSESDQRLQDRIDLQSLCAAATDADFAEVVPLLDLIVQRGFAREKDLHAIFTQYRPEPT
jgi:hypothetical protein